MVNLKRPSVGSASVTSLTIKGKALFSLSFPLRAFQICSVSSIYCHSWQSQYFYWLCGSPLVGCGCSRLWSCLLPRSILYLVIGRSTVVEVCLFGIRNLSNNLLKVEQLEGLYVLLVSTKWHQKVGRVGDTLTIALDTVPLIGNATGKSSILQQCRSDALWSVIAM